MSGNPFPMNESGIIVEKVEDTGTEMDYSQTPESDVTASCNVLEREIRNGVARDVIHPRVAPIMNTFADFLATVGSQVQAMSTAMDATFAKLDAVLEDRENHIDMLGSKIGTSPEVAEKRQLPKLKETAAAIAEIQSDFPDLYLISPTDPLSPYEQSLLRIGDHVFETFVDATFFLFFRKKENLEFARIVKKSASPQNILWDVSEKYPNEFENDELREIAMLVFELQAERIEKFRTLIENVNDNLEYVCATPDPIFGVGVSGKCLREKLPDNFPGKNFYGKWLKEFALSYKSGTRNSDEIADLESSCKIEGIKLPPGKNKVLLLSDVMLAGYRGRGNTDLVYEYWLTLNKDKKSGKATALRMITEDYDNFDQYAAVVILCTTWEIGESLCTDKIKTGFGQLIKIIREKSQDVAIVLANGVPRIDMFAENIVFINHALETAVADSADPNVMILDLFDAFGGNDGSAKTYLRRSGFAINKQEGRSKMSDVLTDKLPFLLFYETSTTQKRAEKEMATSEGNSKAKNPKKQYDKKPKYFDKKSRQYSGKYDQYRRGNMRGGRRNMRGVFDIPGRGLGTPGPPGNIPSLFPHGMPPKNTSQGGTAQLDQALYTDFSSAGASSFIGPAQPADKKFKTDY